MARPIGGPPGPTSSSPLGVVRVATSPGQLPFDMVVMARGLSGVGAAGRAAVVLFLCEEMHSAAIASPV